MKVPPAKEKMELTWWGQSFEEAGSPIRFNIRHTVPFGSKGAKDVRGIDMAATDEQLEAIAADLGLSAIKPSDMGDLLIEHVKRKEGATVVKATPPAPPPSQ